MAFCLSTGTASHFQSFIRLDQSSGRGETDTAEDRLAVTPGRGDGDGEQGSCPGFGWLFQPFRQPHWFGFALAGFRVLSTPTRRSSQFPFAPGTPCQPGRLGSLRCTRQRFAACIVSARPYRLGREAKLAGDDRLNGGPGSLQRFSGGSRVIAVRERQAGEGPSAFLQRGQDIGGVPIGRI